MALKFSPSQIEFIESGVSLYAASRDRRYVPSVSRVAACHVDREEQYIYLWLLKSQSEQLIMDCLDSDRIALVLCDPLTHITWQIKGDGVCTIPENVNDSGAVVKHLDDFSKVLTLIGFAPAFTQSLCAYTECDLRVVSFTPQAIFDQTPGPHAGALIAGGGQPTSATP